MFKINLKVINGNKIYDFIKRLIQTLRMKSTLCLRRVLLICLGIKLRIKMEKIKIANQCLHNIRNRHLHNITNNSSLNNIRNPVLSYLNTNDRTSTTPTSTSKTRESTTSKGVQKRYQNNTFLTLT